MSIRESAKKVEAEIARTTATALAGAFAFVIALTWNSAIQKAIHAYVQRFNIPETVYFYEFVVALIVTFIGVIGIMIASRYKAQ